MKIEVLKDIVQGIKEQADELKQKGKLDMLDYGQMLGLCESLAIIKNSCHPDLWEYVGLDFDIDAHYL